MIGEHRLVAESGDLVLMQLIGDISEREADSINELAASWCRGRDGVFFIVDLTRCGEVKTHVRRRIVEGLRPIPGMGTAFVGASLRHRVMLQMMSKAAGLLLRREILIAFCDTEREARAWVDARRRELSTA